MLRKVWVEAGALSAIHTAKQLAQPFPAVSARFWRIDVTSRLTLCLKKFTFIPLACCLIREPSTSVTDCAPGLHYDTTKDWDHSP